MGGAYRVSWGRYIHNFLSQWFFPHRSNDLWAYFLAWKRPRFSRQVVGIDRRAFSHAGKGGGASLACFLVSCASWAKTQQYTMLIPFFLEFFTFLPHDFVQSRFTVISAFIPALMLGRNGTLVSTVRSFLCLYTRRLHVLSLRLSLTFLVMPA